MNTLLKVKDLRIDFLVRGVVNTAVKDISFTIERGSIVGLVGESGSGKSVSSLALMRLLPDAAHCKISGSILFSDKGKNMELLRLKEHELSAFRGQKMSMVFQEPMTSLNPVFTCGEQITEMLCLHLGLGKRAAKKSVLAYFEQVKLQDSERIFKSYPHQLSGGQKQRVMIAMAICCQPDLLIADEPTTALDVTVQKDIIALLKELRDQLDISILFITHDLGVIKEIADKLLVMYHGEIVERGAADQLFHHPKHPYTKGLLASRPPLDIDLVRLPTMDDFVKLEDGKVMSGNSDVEEVMQALRKEENPDAIKDLSPDILRVKNLIVRFPGKRNFLGKISNWTYAVNKVSFGLKKGEILGLAGESGCGKSTLSRAILRLIDVQAGKVNFDGIDIFELSEKEMRKLRPKMQLIFQDPYSSLNPRLSIEEAIIAPMRLHGLFKNNRERREYAEELMSKVGLFATDLKKYPHEFSGGQRQRICIARTLALKPELIICDESVSALDVSVQAVVLNLLLELKDEFGFSCIFISHDLSVVKFVSDRIMIMNKGRIEELNTAKQIFKYPQSAYTRKLLSAIPE
ncbi:MAG TPA: ABC transporter ATP-binding protein [Chitinophagaceae bacterium]|nr:ABC transporter ATP-binding protein [Chitinophagaceae bacterium]